MIKKASTWRRTWYFKVCWVKGKLHRLLQKVFPLCDGFKGPCFKLGERRRQRTAYHEDDLNWVFLCDKCAEINQEHWDEMWSEYYSQVI